MQARLNLVKTISNENKEKALQADLVCISDVHLQKLDSINGQRLLRLCDDIADGQVEHFVLLGDIFEFFLGSSPYYRRKFAALGQALEHVARSGTKVTFVEGNHEFALDKVPWQGVEIITCRDHFIKFRDRRAKITHGDLVYSPKAYRAFRSVVKARWFLYLAQFIPGPVLDYLAMRGAEASRAQDTYRQMNHKAILAAMDSWFNGEADFALFGHFHVPYAHPSFADKGALLSLSSWDQPNLLVYHEGFRRLLYRGEELRPSTEKVVTWEGKPKYPSQ